MDNIDWIKVIMVGSILLSIPCLYVSWCLSWAIIDLIVAFTKSYG